ncbi:VOC family protein [Sorangium sp. So ce327]|jgi:catechol 2,3-dioxygenase-like lactoylglutathione lyase family enzyme|uniref:VOC family protein n=1 Tax=unclassified Sorangium TaxID=2621164 RepID=UPI003F6260AE
MSGTVAPLSVHHLAVVVRDLVRAEAFYAGVLGLPVVRRWTDEAGAPRSVWLELGGGAFLAVERAGAAGPMRADEAPGWHCVALGITPSEREAWRRRLAAGGVIVERESAYTMYARDPDGNLVALSHYPHPRAGPG